MPWLDGACLFGDFFRGQTWAGVCRNNGNCELIWIVDLPRPISSFGRDLHGELYVADFGGSILQIVESESGFMPSTAILSSQTFEPPEIGG